MIPFTSPMDQYILGPEVGEFEKQWAVYNHIRGCLGTSSGTAAIHLALLSLDVGPGDEVITVPNTFIATTNPILYCGATIKFVDVKPDTALIDIEQLEQAINNKTKAILVVDLYGQMPDMQRIQELGMDYDVKIIEDACQAHGSLWNSHPPGFYSDIACYSFYPSKNLGCHGDAGAVTSNNDSLMEYMRMLSNHGRRNKYLHDHIGYNYRMDTIQAKVLLEKLPSLQSNIEKRRRHAAFYNQHLQNCIIEAEGATHSYHLYVIKTEHRKETIERFKEKGIGYGIHYPVPLHHQLCYSHLGFHEYPVSEYLGRTVLSLPMYPELSEEDSLLVVDVLNGK